VKTWPESATFRDMLQGFRKNAPDAAWDRHAEAHLTKQIATLSIAAPNAIARVACRGNGCIIGGFGTTDLNYALRSAFVIAGAVETFQQPRADGCLEVVAALWRHPLDKAGPHRIETMGPLVCDRGVATPLDQPCRVRFGPQCFENLDDACACACTMVAGASAAVDGCQQKPEAGSIYCAKPPTPFW
jgi:hypothetical protein